ncbi:patatin-like phospholipase family protein [Alkalibacterium olivapovliticus]|uniref:Putative patatin/cPLA2 family phospholipase n=1 Tax=Alkalibacterium olivapovliticus TaxID=99907 RepID=A0A2T0WBZ4_9LACT|nr:patatin family protein [Alkalibacterium olivapovliticus]PRY84225.1 putative patatin/cPLA2 family phospholipase [Alkalibacterium olivapovliticus]
MSVGMVLEGGGMRGLYTAGVLDTLIDEKISIDGMVTVSAGALFGINFASGQKGRALRYNKTYINDKRYISLRSLIRTGDMVNKEFAYYTVPFSLDIFDEEAFKASGIAFYATVTNMETGEPEYITITDPFHQMEMLRASGSMPFVSKPVVNNGVRYLDGGVSDSIPYEKAKSLGYDKTIVILTRPLAYRKTKPSRFVIDRWYRHYPKFKKTLKNRYANYNQTVEKITEDEQSGEAFVIRPSQTIQIGRLERDPDKLQAIYDLGVQDAIMRLAELKQYINQS